MIIKPFLKPYMKDFTTNQVLLTWLVLTVAVSSVIIVPMLNHMNKKNK